MAPTTAANVEATPRTVLVPTSQAVTQHAHLTREYRVPLDDENDAEIRFFGAEFGLPQIEALSDFVAFIKKQLQRKCETSPRRSQYDPEENP